MLSMVPFYREKPFPSWKKRYERCSLPFVPLLSLQPLFDFLHQSRRIHRLQERTEGQDPDQQFCLIRFVVKKGQPVMVLIQLHRFLFQIRKMQEGPFQGFPPVHQFQHSRVFQRFRSRWRADPGSFKWIAWREDTRRV